MQTIVPTVTEFSMRDGLSDEHCFNDHENRFLEAMCTYNPYLNQAMKELDDIFSVNQKKVCDFFSNKRSKRKLETTQSTRLQRKYFSPYVYCPL